MRGSKHQTGTLTADPEGGDVEEDVDEKNGFFACYLLCSLCPRYKGHTYIGCQLNLIQMPILFPPPPKKLFRSARYILTHLLLLLVFSIIFLVFSESLAL